MRRAKIYGYQQIYGRELEAGEIYRLEFAETFYRLCLEYVNTKDLAAWAVKNKEAFELILSLQDNQENG